MKYAVVTIISILLFAPPLFAQRDITSDMELFSQSIATVDDISAGFINPACLGIGPWMALRYMHATTDSTIKGDDGFILATRGNLLSAQWLNHTDGKFRRKFLFAGGKQVFPKFYWGLSIGYFNGTDRYDKKKVWKTGFLSTPTPFINLAAVIDDINQPKIGDRKVHRLYMVGAAFKARALDFKFSADSWLRENHSFDEIEGKFRFEITIKRKLNIAAHYHTEGRIGVGIGYNIAHIGVGFGGNFDQEDVLGGNFFYNQLPIGARP